VFRSDKGTENVVMEDMQKFIRRNHLDQFKGDQSFIYGSSQHNQRIECWWGFLRRSTTQFYMDVFQEMKDNDYFDGGFLDKNLIRFCFMDIIQVRFWLQSKVHRVLGSELCRSKARRFFTSYKVSSFFSHCILF
jgi:hypothetical protein